MSLTQRIASIHQRIAAAAHRTGRSPTEVTLIAVTKTHPPELIREAQAAGVLHMGENRVQELERKVEALADLRPQITWHLIGHVQRNKARRALELADLMHSVDSVRLAETLSRIVGENQTEDRKPETEAGRPETRDPSTARFVSLSNGRAGRRPEIPMPVLLQVNVSGEASKEGFDLPGGVANEAGLATFLAEVEHILAQPGLAVQGLMTIAPYHPDPEQARPTFRALRELRDRLAQHFPQVSWHQLSMGMSDDFEVAIEEGATLVRVGRAVFGERT
ncbi:MAG: YggS family pyridoxal phosphate enzyme [Chloroflexaceae bacterium]|jgi:hypothetical protein|nr:YggS family pyridoxal phosphate enzyme [Chloroflexaceae bacterium]